MVREYCDLRGWDFNGACRLGAERHLKTAYAVFLEAPPHPRGRTVTRDEAISTTPTPLRPRGYQDDGSYEPCPECRYVPPIHDGPGIPAGLSGTIHNADCPTVPRLSPGAAAKLQADLDEMAACRSRAWASCHNYVIGWRRVTDSVSRDEATIGGSMLTYQGAETKRQLLKRLRDHRAADEIIQGTYWGADHRGCAVGCATEDPYGGHDQFPARWGIPVQVAYLVDQIFESLPVAVAKDWPVRVMSAVPVGADLSRVYDQWCAWMLHRLVANAAEFGEILDPSVGVMASLFDRAGVGDEPPASEWEEAAGAAGAAWAEAARAGAAGAAGAAARHDWARAAAAELVRLVRAAPKAAP